MLIKPTSLFIAAWLLLLACYHASAQKKLHFYTINLNPAPFTGSRVTSLTPIGEWLYMSAESDRDDAEIIRTKGTPMYVSYIKDINPGNLGSIPAAFRVFGDKIIFTAETRDEGRELWCTQGSVGNTYMISDIDTGIGSSDPRGFIEYNNRLLFSAHSARSLYSAIGRELWATDGTEAGTVLIKNINTGPQFANNSNPDFFTIYNGKVYFAATTHTNGRELWVTDGTEAGTVMVKDLTNTANASSNPEGLIVHNGKLLFSAANPGNSSQRALWETDGTAAGTRIVKAINITPLPASRKTVFTPYNNLLYFFAHDGINGPELWHTDGTDAGTALIKNATTTALGTYEDIVIMNNKMYYPFSNITHGFELWQSDGTDTGTYMLHNMYYAALSSMPRHLTVYKNRLFYTALDSTERRAIFSTDGQQYTTHEPPNITKAHPLDTFYFKGFTIFNDALYFCAFYDSLYGAELWVLTDSPDYFKLSTTEIKGSNALSLYPNPASAYVHLQTNISFKEGMAILRSSTGAVIRQYTLQHGNNKHSLPVQDIPPGMYIITVKLDDKIQSEKLQIHD
ncbi:MAG: T9SS type A sorting domain-containing protein [Flavipsychrobacter sp.]|nr:T9SS type A sorting domain-containing protein [Flavipsychrobacter sp.]